MATLSRHLEKTGQTQAEFAARVKTTQATISRICSGRIPSPSLITKITEATGGEVTPNDFYGVAV